MFAACETPTTIIPATQDSAPSKTGRYVFHMEPTTADTYSGGFLLDTATGDMWIVAHTTPKDGSPGSIVLAVIPKAPTRRYNPATGQVEDSPKLSAEELIKKYGR